MKKINQLVTFIFVIGILLCLTGNFNVVKYLGYLIGIITVFVVIWRVRSDGRGKDYNSKFEKRMKELGFTERIVVYDFFLQPTKTRIRSGFGWEHWWTVGVWINNREERIALRTNKNSWEEIVVPFGKIKDVYILPDEYTKTHFGGVVVGGFVFGSSKSKGISKGMQVVIVVGDDTHGIEPYYLNLYDSAYSGKLNQSNPDYQAIVVCAQSIYNKINNIMNIR